MVFFVFVLRKTCPRPPPPPREQTTIISLSLIFVFVFFKCYTRNRRAKTAQNRILQNSRVVVYVVVVVVVRTVYMCESTEREQHKRRAFGENVVLICCYSSTCDVTEKKRYAKNIIHSFEREQHGVLCVFIRVVVPPKKKKCFGVFFPPRQKTFCQRERGRKESFINLAAFSDVCSYR